MRARGKGVLNNAVRRSKQGLEKPVITEIEPEIRKKSKTIGSVQSASLEKKVLLKAVQNQTRERSSERLTDGTFQVGKT